MPINPPTFSLLAAPVYNATPALPVALPVLPTTMELVEVLAEVCMVVKVVATTVETSIVDDPDMLVRTWVLELTIVCGS